MSGVVSKDTGSFLTSVICETMISPCLLASISKVNSSTPVGELGLLRTLWSVAFQWLVEFKDRRIFSIIALLWAFGSWSALRLLPVTSFADEKPHKTSHWKMKKECYPWVWGVIANGNTSAFAALIVNGKLASVTTIAPHCFKKPSIIILLCERVRPICNKSGADPESFIIFCDNVTICSLSLKYCVRNLQLSWSRCFLEPSTSSSLQLFSPVVQSSRPTKAYY